MILYFSATGNCKYVAGRLSEAAGDEALSVVDCMREGRREFEDDMIVIVSPTYYWALPAIMKRFLTGAEFRADYICLVATYGTTTGAIRQYTEKEIGRKLDAFFSVRMADSFTPMFDISTPEKLLKFTSTTEQEIEQVINAVSERKRVKSPSMPKPLAMFFAQPLYNLSARKTSKLWVRDSCTGCGKCARKCPVQAIEMKNNRPVWVKDKCEMCLGCLHRCPEFAIQYGNGVSEKHGQYTNPNVTL